MPVLNFDIKIAAKIIDGSVKQTIRKLRKTPVKINDTLYLYSGHRTSSIHLLIEPPPKCVRTDNLLINNDKLFINNRSMPLISCQLLDDFANDNGFDSFQTLFKFVKSKYGIPFNGQIIYW